MHICLWELDHRTDLDWEEVRKEKGKHSKQFPGILSRSQWCSLSPWKTGRGGAGGMHNSLLELDHSYGVGRARTGRKE